jgi:hypothetical protein
VEDDPRSLTTGPATPTEDVCDACSSRPSSPSPPPPPRRPARSSSSRTPRSRPATETRERAAKLGIDVEHRFSRTLRGFAADLTPAQTAALERDPEVAAIVPDRPVRKLAAVPAQAGTRIPPGVRRVTRAAAGEVRQKASHSVAVLDTGVDLEHPDLDVVAGTNCTGAGAPDDTDGHGTHVAGTIGAKDDGVGVAGVAPGTRLVAVKVLDDTGAGTTSSVICGIEWVLANRTQYDIRVANLSLGGEGRASSCKSNVEHAAYCALASAGVVPVVAAGNFARDFADSKPDTPAAYPEVLTVAATTDTDGLPGGLGAAGRCPNGVDDTPASFSNFATTAAAARHLIAAPGDCIRSTLPGARYGTLSGTSMATPHVAALVALCQGEAGTPGSCAGLSTPAVIRHMIATATAATDNGFVTADATRLYGPMAVLPGTEAVAQAPEPAEPPAEDEPDGTSDAAAETAPPVVEPPAADPVPDPVPDPVLQPAPIFPPAQPRTAPPTEQAGLAVLGRATLRSLRSSGLRVRIACGGRCIGAVTLRLATRTFRRGGLPIVLAGASVSRDGTVTLRPTARVRAALGRLRTVRVTVELRVGQARQSRTLTLRRG